MSPFVAACVVDASVGVKLVLPETGSDRAAALFDLLKEFPPAILHVPDLFYVECTNVLWKHARRGHLTAAAAEAGMAILLGLHLTVTNTTNLAQSALDLALHHDISVYDAAYVALASRLAIPLVTADEALVSKLERTTCLVKSLGAFVVPPASPP